MRFLTILLASLILLPLPRSGSHPDSATSATAVMQTLKAYSDAYWARVAGRDDSLPPHVNGHDELGTRWLHDMRAALRGVPFLAIRQEFKTPGFKNLPADRPGVNLIVAVPGTRAPDQSVIVGTHYDGEPFSKGSAYDDTSGVAITLQVARLMAPIWHAQGLPARTVEFVLFDAEEQGMIGSEAYVQRMQHGALLPRPTLMVDEEQNGVGYPVRPFGLLSNEPLPAFAWTSDPLPPVLGKIHPIPAAQRRLLHSQLVDARGAVFRRLHAAVSPLRFQGGAAPAFTSADESLVRIGRVNICCSDNAPFEVAGYPNVTFAGDAGYYDRNPPPWAYPFDQPQDTFTTLACDTGGSPTPSPALAAALDLPVQLTLELLHDNAPPSGRVGPPAVLSPQVAVAGTALHLAVSTGGTVHYDFGDGTRGTNPVHTYRRPGHYKLRVIDGRRSAVQTIVVRKQALGPDVPLGVIGPPPIRPWHPDALSGVAGCP